MFLPEGLDCVLQKFKEENSVSGTMVFRCQNLNNINQIGLKERAMLRLTEISLINPDFSISCAVVEMDRNLLSFKAIARQAQENHNIPVDQATAQGNL